MPDRKEDKDPSVNFPVWILGSPSPVGTQEYLVLKQAKILSDIRLSQYLRPLRPGTCGIKRSFGSAHFKSLFK